MGFMKCPNCSKDISDQATTCPSCGHPIKETNLEPKFHAFRIRVLTGSAILCAFGIPIGFVMKMPYVWILGIIGIVVAEVKLLHLISTSKGGFMDSETRAPGWKIRCLKCGFTEPWGKYGIRKWAIGKEYTIGWCSSCGWLRIHVIEKPKTEEINQETLTKPNDEKDMGYN